MIHWMLVVIPVLALACNRTDGKCWYRGEGEGDYGSAAGVGGSFGVGVGVGVGAGVGGDAYYSPQGVGDHDEDEPICDELDQPQIEPDKVIVCKKKAWGVDCMIACAEAGLSCPAGMKHRLRPEVGMGLLWKCAGETGKEECKYIYENGDECTWYRDQKLFLCKYPGG